MIISSFTYFSNMLCAVKLSILGLMAYWYTGSAFHQIPQSYHITTSVKNCNIFSVIIGEKRQPHYRYCAIQFN